ncbi:MAG: hypothetical protein HZB51_16685 [Chloroflexi bacterium]|nr:hypothetical protein [Chloroflexota bacterium]
MPSPMRDLKTFRVSFIFMLVTLAVLATVSLVVAAFYPINTDDSSAADWSSVSVFRTDPTGDVITATEDIVNVWIATSAVTTTPESLNFMIETSAAPALNPPGTNTRAAMAIIDCDQDGFDNEVHDRKIAFLISGNSSYDDMTLVAQGSFPESGGYFILPGPEYGERVGETAFVEWRVPVSELPPDDQDPDTNCRGSVYIRFATARVTISIFGSVTVTTVDEISSLTVYNVETGEPTSVTLSSFRAATDDAWQREAILLALASVAAILWISVVVTARRRG